MVSQPARLATARPWLVDLSDRRGIHPAWLGAAATLLVFASSQILGHAFGWLDFLPLVDARFWQEPHGWFELTQAAAIGFALAATPYAFSGARRDVAALQPLLDASAGELDAQVDDWSRFRRPTLVALDLLALLVALRINLDSTNWPDGRPVFTDPFLLWTTLRTVLVVWAVGRLMLAQAVIARHLRVLGLSLARVDLLDLTALSPFGRNGLRSVLLWMLLSALFAFQFLADFGHDVVIRALLATALAAPVSFLVPVSGARIRVAAAKQAELAQVRRAIRARRAGEPDETAGPQAGWSLPDLLAWEARVERVPHWPFDAPTLARLALYVAVGLGSWVGAALVERALGAALE